MCLPFCRSFSLSIHLNRFPLKEEEKEDEEDAKEVTIPTHWDKLDPKSMKVRHRNLHTCRLVCSLARLIQQCRFQMFPCVFLNPGSSPSDLSPPPSQVNDLRKELDCRSLSSKGLKSQLIARLTKQLKVEEQVEEAKEPEKPEVKVPDEEEPPQEEDKEVGPWPSVEILESPQICI